MKILLISRHRSLWISLCLVAALSAWQVGMSQGMGGAPGLGRLDALIYDWRFQLLPPQRAENIPIVIVDLDEFTQQREGRWPWDRRKVADLLTTLQDRGAALIGMDVVFSEPTLNPARQLLEAAALPDSARSALHHLSNDFDGDAALARALGGNVLLGYFLHAEGVKSGALPFPLLELSPDAQQTSTLIAMPDYTGNLAMLTENAVSGGFVTAVPDADGIVRRVPLIMRHDTGVYASLTLEMARLALDAPWLRLALDERGARQVATGVHIGKHVRVPLDDRGNLLAPYKGKARSYPYLSATRVLRGNAPEHELALLDGALVLVGTSALGLADLRTSPLQTAYPGVEVHANVLDTLLQAALGENTIYLEPDWEAGATLVSMALSGLLLALLLPGRSPLLMLLLSGSWLAVIIGVNFGLWHLWHMALPLAMQLLTVVVIAAFNIGSGYLKTNRQKREIQGMFGQYVPAAYVERMVAHPELASWEGEEREMTVLFADVRGFTAMSEGLSASQLKQVLNRYLTAITETIFEHHGTIDKYVGDMVMAFWNAPLDDARHAEHAVATALHMQQRMVALRDEFQKEGFPAFQIGIGLSTGSMNVGDMGSNYRRAYTVLGDAVNLGARLEGVTAFYGVPVLVSDATRRQADAFFYRTIDLIRVKGKQEPVEASEPICLLSEVQPTLRECVRQFELAQEHYRSRRWPLAREILQRLLEEDPQRHKLYSLYLQRMNAVDHQTLPPEWTGVYDHEEK
jgi:adenylate cyclase